MRLLVLWLHVLGAIVWLGGLAYQAHGLLPAARRGEVAAFAAAAARWRAAAWVALSLVVVTGVYNLTGLGPLEALVARGAGLVLAAKVLLVLVLVPVASQRDFAQVPRLRRLLAAGEDPGPALRAIAWLDRAALALGVVIVYLGLALARR